MPSNDSRAWFRGGRRIIWSLSLAFVLLPWQSAFWSDHVEWSLKIVIAGVTVLAAFQPAATLLVVAAIAPFGHLLVTSVWHAYPFALTESLVLAFFAGYLWWRRREFADSDAADDLTAPTWLLATVLVASCAVRFVVVQILHDFPLPYAHSFLTFLTTEYLTAIPDPRPAVDGRGFVATAALILEGVALMRATRTLCAQQPALVRKLLTVIVIAGTVAAVLSFSFMASAVHEGHLSMATVLSERWSTPAIPSLDSAGTYFMLMAFLAISLAGVSARSLTPLIVVAVIVIFGAMLATHTRAAVVASVMAAAGGGTWYACRHSQRLSSMKATALAAVVAVAVSALVITVNPLHILAEGGDTAMHIRVLMARTAIRMMESSPLTGIGVGRYKSRYFDFATRDLLRWDPRKNNAHDYFLWLGAETGAVGLALFLWILGATLWDAAANVRRGDNAISGWTYAGLIGFMVTWSIGQPMSIQQVAFASWIALGLAAHPSVSTVPGNRLWRSPWRRLTLVVASIVIIASVPSRVRRETADMDLKNVSYGFYNQGEAEDHRTFQWVGPHVRFFLASDVRAIEMPMAAKLGTTPYGVDVAVFVNTRPAANVILSDRDWHTVKIATPLAPGSADRFWQVDLNLTPIDIPSTTPDEDRRIALADIVADRR